MPTDEADRIVLEARNLSRTVGRTRLVDDVSFKVHRGDVYVLVGADDAGKTTVANMLVGLVTPTTGEAEVLGTRMGPGAFAVFERVGFASGHPAFPGGLTARQNLTAVTALRGASNPDAVDRVLDRLGLASAADQRASTLGDDRTRLLGIARAVVSSPEVLVLDEPTRGLGVVDRKAVIGLIRELAVERQVTVMMCARAVEGLTDLATHVGVLHQGRLVEEFDREGLRERGRAHVEVVVSDTARAARVLEQELGHTDFAVCQEQLIRIYISGDHAGEINAAFQKDGITVSRLSVNESSLDELLERLATEGDERP